jgi:hypothetical protein
MRASEAGLLSFVAELSMVLRYSYNFFCTAKRTQAMSVVLQFTADEEAQALPILLRHSPGSILPNRTYVIGESAAQALRDAGISYREVRPQLNLPTVEDISIGERI